MIIRNDDVAADTSLSHLERFCRICDRAGVRIMQAITVAGRCLPVDREMDNSEIVEVSRGVHFSDRADLIQFLRSRHDIIAVHGLYHTHEPSLSEIQTASSILTSVALTATHFVPPFNEGNYGDPFHGFSVSAGDAFKLESAIAKKAPIPNDVKVGYLHSWRFDPDCPREYINRRMKRRFTLDDLEAALNERPSL